MDKPYIFVFCYQWLQIKLGQIFDLKKLFRKFDNHFRIQVSNWGKSGHPIHFGPEGSKGSMFYNKKNQNA